MGIPDSRSDMLREKLDELFGKTNEKNDKPTKKSLEEFTQEEILSGAIEGAKAILGDSDADEYVRKEATKLELNSEQDIEFRLASHVSMQVDETPAKSIAEGIGVEWDEKQKILHRAAVMGGAANMFWFLKENGCLKPEFLKRAREMYEEMKSEETKEGGKGNGWR